MAATKDVTVVRLKEASPTALMAQSLQTAFDFFNKELFGGKLPQAIILLHRKKNAKGYFWAERFGDREGKLKVDEIALNPSVMRGRDDRDTLSTLVHEMVHQEQQHFGKAPKSAYHNKEWADWMERVGLMPSVTGKVGGARTGAQCTHYIIDGGLFDVACAKLLGKGLALPYSERKFTEGEKKRAGAKRASKTKFCCPTCDQAAWGKPTLQITCSDCGEEMEAE